MKLMTNMSVDFNLQYHRDNPHGKSNHTADPFYLWFQYAVGFFSFLLLLICNKGTAGFRASLVPVHAAFGILTFVLGVCACLTGLTEKAIFSLGYVESQFIDRKSWHVSYLRFYLFCNFISFTFGV